MDDIYYRGTSCRFVNIYSEKVLGIIRPIETERYFEKIKDSNVFENINVSKSEDLQFFEYKDFYTNFLNFGDIAISKTYNNYMNQLSYKFKKGNKMLDNYYPIFIGDVCLEFNSGKYNKFGKFYCVPIYKNTKIFHNINSWKYRNKSEEYIRVNNIKNDISDFEFIEECFYETFQEDFYFFSNKYKDMNEESELSINFNKFNYYKNELLKQLQNANSLYTYSFITRDKRVKKYVRIEPIGYLVVKKNIYTSGMY